jgi:hypothetical protein
MTRRLTLLAALATLVVLGAPATARAQLVSPGKLAAPHAQLEGMANCTKCHDLGKRGASDVKCLSCHTTLARRIEAKKGLHATYTARTCATCHKEHFGVDFALVRFDTARFDHAKETGFALRLAHAETDCRSCHTGSLIADPAVRTYATEHRTLDRTYLGLATGCTDCHAGDDVHGGQFGKRPCTACHTEATWEKAPRFSHDSTRYPLTGSHRTAKCESCHKPMAVAGVVEPVTRYVGVKAATCTACHTDPHQGRMRQSCESCHDTESWVRLTNRTAFEANFDHARTKFALAGAHATAPCAACHDPSWRPRRDLRIAMLPGQGRASYPAPRVTAGCLSCHVDAHDSAFVRTPGGRDCKNCHGETAWIPSAYDLLRHNRETYVLTGAHVAVACRSCHLPVRNGGPPRFSPLPKDCATCHKQQDPHVGQFSGRACTDCHVTETFKVAAFDHSRTRYPLDGAHRQVACAKCHLTATGPDGKAFTRYRPLETTCKACHGAAIPRRP